MIKVLRTVLYVVAATATLLGLWGILANLAIPLMPDYGNTRWNFFGPFEAWNDTGTPGGHARELRIPWWAISFQTPCPYLDPVLAGPVGYGFYALCFSWGMGTIIMLRWNLRAGAGWPFWPALPFGALWLIGLTGIVAHAVFFASIARVVALAGLTP